MANLLEERTKKYQQYREVTTKINSDLKKAILLDDCEQIKIIIKKQLERIENVKLITL